MHIIIIYFENKLQYGNRIFKFFLTTESIMHILNK